MVIKNPREKAGEKQYGVLFDQGKVRRRREWRQSLWPQKV